jgi:hypothetical protein
MQIIMKGMDGKSISLEVEPNTTVAQLLKLVSDKINYPEEYLKLVFAGMSSQADGLAQVSGSLCAPLSIERQPMKTLECLKITDNSIIHFMRLPQWKWLCEKLEDRERDKMNSMA